MESNMICGERAVQDFTAPQLPLNTTCTKPGRKVQLFDAALLFFGTFCRTQCFKIEDRLAETTIGFTGTPAVCLLFCVVSLRADGPANPILFSRGNHNEKNTAICTAGCIHLAWQHWKRARATASFKGKIKWATCRDGIRGNCDSVTSQGNQKQG